MIYVERWHSITLQIVDVKRSIESSLRLCLPRPRPRLHSTLCCLLSSSLRITTSYQTRYIASGVDLNRQWKSPLRTAHPTIQALKSFMHLMKKARDINMYIDLHGHSRKYNVFMYGCDDKKKAKPLVRAFPKFFSTHSVGGKYVSYADCSFHVRKGRESTARVVVSKELNIPLSFTLEATFCGSNYGPYQVGDSGFFSNLFIEEYYHFLFFRSLLQTHWC